MIRSLALRWPSLGSNACPANTSGEFGETEDPCFPHLASPNRIGAGNSAPSKFDEKASANSDKLGGFMSRYERFGRHENSSNERRIANGEHVRQPVHLASILFQASPCVQDFAPIGLLVFSIAHAVKRAKGVPGGARLTVLIHPRDSYFVLDFPQERARRASDKTLTPWSSNLCRTFLNSSF
jgi:hypothetical protein